MGDIGSLLQSIALLITAVTGGLVAIIGALKSAKKDREQGARRVIKVVREDKGDDDEMKEYIRRLEALEDGDDD